MNLRTTSTGTPLGDAEIGELQQLLDSVPAPLEPLDAMAVDGFLCGTLLQPQAVAADDWLPFVTDLEARPLPPSFDAARLHALVRDRAAEIERAIAARDWFDPWVYQLDGEATPSQAVLPWVAGFAAALEAFPALAAVTDSALDEPLALMYRHFDADDLEDADSMLALIDTLEPPEDLAEAVQDLVRAVMLIADVTRPQPKTPSARARPGRGPRSRSGRRGRARPPGTRRRCGRPATAARSTRR